MTARDERDRHLAAYASVISPPADRRARNFEALERRLAEGAVIPTSHARGSAVAPRASVAVAISIAIAAAALVLLWAGANGVRALRESARAPVHEAPATAVGASAERETVRAPDRPDAGPRVAVERAGDTNEATPSSIGRSTADPVARVEASSRGAGGNRSAATSETDDVAIAEDRLRDELALVRAARSAMKRGDFERVWALTGAHASQHPAGGLAHERDAWRTLAACRLAHADAGERFAAFARAHDDSPYLARVRAECGIP